MKNIMKEMNNLGKMLDFCATNNKAKEIKIDFKGHKMIMDLLNEKYNKKYNEDNFDFTLATKSFLNLINKGIQAYKKEIGYINLDSNDKIYLSSLFVNGFLWNKEVASTL